MRLTSWQATTFLVGEFQLAEDRRPSDLHGCGRPPVAAPKRRSQFDGEEDAGHEDARPGAHSGLHTFRITERGVQVFPRLIFGLPETPPVAQRARPGARPPRLSVGVPRLDEMLGGGIPSGYSVLVAGPSGSGKTVLATEFLREGARHGEPGVIAVFEKRPSEYAQTSAVGLDQAVRDGQVGIIHTRPLDLSIDETLHELTEAIHRLKARRVVIDSLSGFELALAPTFREDFRESLYRLVAALTGMGVTVMMTAELEDSYTDLRFSPAWDGVSDRRDHPAAVSRARRPVEARDDGRESPGQCPPEGPAPVRDHRRRHCRRRTDRGLSRTADGDPHAVSPGSRQPPRRSYPAAEVVRHEVFTHGRLRVRDRVDRPPKPPDDSRAGRDLRSSANTLADRERAVGAREESARGREAALARHATALGVHGAPAPASST